MTKSYLKLRHSESVVIQAASQIFAAYIANGTVNSHSEQELIHKSVEQAIKIAELADDRIISDSEVDDRETLT